MTVSCGDPLSARAVKVVLVTFFRGEGDMRREVLQVFAEDGELLAEHDAIHEDPVYASYFLRERVTSEMLCIWAGAASHGKCRNQNEKGEAPGTSGGASSMCISTCAAHAEFDKKRAAPSGS